MSIRLRRVDGILVALCAVESDGMDGDVYLDDEAHAALAAKFARDWQGQVVNWSHPLDDAAAATQKVRDAEEEIIRWQASVKP